MEWLLTELQIYKSQFKCNLRANPRHQQAALLEARNFLVWSNRAPFRSGFPILSYLPFARTGDESACWLSKPLSNEASIETKPGCPGTVPCTWRTAWAMQHLASLLPKQESQDMHRVY